MGEMILIENLRKRKIWTFSQIVYLRYGERVNFVAC